MAVLLTDWCAMSMGGEGIKRAKRLAKVLIFMQFVKLPGLMSERCT